MKRLNYWFNAKRKYIINCDEKFIFNFTRRATSSQLCLLVQKFYKLVESSRVNTVRYICLLHIWHMQYQLLSVEFKSIMGTGPQLVVSLEILTERRFEPVVLCLQGVYVNRYAQTTACFFFFFVLFFVFLLLFFFFFCFLFCLLFFFCFCFLLLLLLLLFLLLIFVVFVCVCVFFFIAFLYISMQSTIRTISCSYFGYSDRTGKDIGNNILYTE